MNEFELLQRRPSVAEYQHLRKSVGWYVVDDQATERGLEKSLFSVCLIHQERVIGCGRIVGDSGIYY